MLRNYTYSNILAFGDLIHRIHPLAGQGFNMTIRDVKIISEIIDDKISLATIYNTVHAFKKAGHLSEVDVRGKKTYFDTNINNHHHFYDNETSELIDIDASEVVIQKIPKAPNGKKIKNVEVFINLKN